MNFPVPEGFNDDEMNIIIKNAILPLGNSIKPDLLIIQFILLSDHHFLWACLKYNLPNLHTAWYSSFHLHARRKGSNMPS